MRRGNFIKGITLDDETGKLTGQRRDAFGKYQLFTGYEGSGRCWWCGGEFRDRRRRRYCGEECRLEYHRHFYWPDARDWALERANHKCSDCDEYATEVHHIIPLGGEPRLWNIKNRPENLVATCRKHHKKREADIFVEMVKDKLLIPEDTW